LRDPAPIGWQARAPNLARAFAWSRALATIDRLTGEIAPRAKQTVRNARAQPSTAASQPPGT
jgi:hypothetical protein